MARLPKLILEIAWSGFPLDDAPDYRRISSGIIWARWTRGRNFRLDRSEAGTCVIRLHHIEGELDPNYPNGPFYGNIDVGKRVRLSVQIGGATYRLFTGFLRALPRFYPGITGDEVELHLTDAFLRLGKHKITTTEDFPEESSGARIVRVLDEVGFPGTGYADAHRDIDTGTSMMASMGLKTRTALEHILHIEQSEMGRFYISGEGKAVWLARHTLLTDAAYNTSQLTFGGFGGIPYQDITPEYGEDLLYTGVRASRVGGEEQSVEDEDPRDDYGSTILDRGELLSTSDSELTDLIYYLLDRHARPTVRFKQLKVLASSDLYILETLLGAELNWRATVRKTHKRLDYTEEQEVILEQMQHSVDYRQGSWTVDFQLSDADSKRYWILGDPVYGVLGETTFWAF